MLDVSVVVPVRNAEDILGQCLESLVRAQPREIIVVDGMSTDRTLEIARQFPVRILSDEGKGLPAARAIGADASTSRLVALVDADVVFPPSTLEGLVAEFEAEGYAALQAGQHSVAAEPGYWGEALAYHHRTGRSKDWFGVVATVFERGVLAEHGFDQAFLSGEDIDLRWRLQRAGAKIGVSKRNIVEHRFGSTFAFAKGQWLADGHGLARMIAKHRSRAVPLLALPLAAAARGIVLSVLRMQPKWIPYYVCFAVFNYVAMFDEFLTRFRSRQGGGALDPSRQSA